MAKVSELAGEQLALWTAKALGLVVKKVHMEATYTHKAGFVYEVRSSNPDPQWSFIGYIGMNLYPQYEPHGKWEYGGRILEQHKISLTWCWNFEEPEWCADMNEHAIKTHRVAYGPTPLIAAMRALVASAYGDTVPDEVAA